ncbi:MAG: hypothetical protein [Siphoviridae sp. ctCJE6]|nr:MAG: hypothetical protein [Siphoviridae sp. ctCJE6]
MGEDTLIQMASKHGLGLVLSCVNFVLLAVVIRFILFENKEDKKVLMDFVKTNQSASHQLISSNQQLLIAHDGKSAAAIKSIEEANRYQREEHMKMIEILNKLNENIIKMDLKLSTNLASRE